MDMKNQESERDNSVQESREKRTRKQSSYKTGLKKVIEDPLELRTNKCSRKARKVFCEETNILIELWFDKHYLDRDQFGDEFGKRLGIDKNTVERLVRQSLKHLVAYSLLIKGFTFINRNAHSHEKSTRIVLQKKTDNGLLNVVVEAHYLTIDKFEMTVKTAMCIEDFRTHDSQYIIELYKDGSLLKINANKIINEICRIEFGDLLLR